MLARLGLKEPGPDEPLASCAVWQTAYSWLDEGQIHPIIASVYYTTPGFEVITVDLDFDATKVELPSRMESMITTSILGEYADASVRLKREYDARKKRRIVVDPYFTE